MPASFGSLGRQDQRCDVGKSVAIAKLVGEKNSNVEDPSRGRNESTRQSRCNLVVGVQDGEDFRSRNTMQSQQEDHREADIEPDPRLLACFSGGRTVDVGIGTP